MLKQELSHKLLQKLSPQQIQFIQLLQLNTSELEKRLDEELAENPALEVEEQDHQDKDNGIPEADESSSVDEEVDNDIQSDFDINEYVSLDEYESFDPNYSSDEDDDNKRELPIASVSTLYDLLNEQLASINLDERELLLANHLIGMIEEDGYLRRPLVSIAYDLAFLNSMKVTEEELDKILKIIQTFDPPGIAARDLQECLLIQLSAKDQKSDKVKLATKIIKNNMIDLANKHYSKLRRQLKIENDELREAIDVITHLNPKPGDSQSGIKTQYIIPDFHITNVENELIVTLNSKNAPELRVNKSYQSSLETYNNSTKKDKQIKDQVQFIKHKLDNAKWFIEAIKQRQNTLLQTMKTILDIQREFFLSGDFNKLRPMILKDVADRINMDISTVSRVANSKYVQTEFGIFSLKEFFSEGIQTMDGKEVSNKKVKNILKKLIEVESKRKPLTDEKLTELLKDQGFNIARRTVAKYREQMHIPVARLRKEL